MNENMNNLEKKVDEFQSTHSEKLLHEICALLIKMEKSPESKSRLTRMFSV